MFKAYDPPGTFFLTLEQGKLEQLNTNYYGPHSLSPSRRRLLQVTNYITESATSFEIYEVMPNGSRLGVFELPGLPFLGWLGDEVVLFATIQRGEATGGPTISEGLTRIDVASGRSQQIPFPDWVVRDPYAPAFALSPDATAAAFVVRTQGAAFAPDGFAMIVVDTDSGAVLEQWPVPPALWPPGGVHWAKDGTIVYHSYAEPKGIAIADRNTHTLGEPIRLPFNPCGVQDWVTPDTLEMSESIVIGDRVGCANSWIVATDGTSAEKRTGESPVALSPDKRKVLLLVAAGELGDGDLVVAEPNGTQQSKIARIPKVHTPLW